MMNENNDAPFATPDGPKSYIDQELYKLVELGKEGKLWTLTVAFSLDGVTSQQIWRNRRREEVIKLRVDIFHIGILHPEGVDHWRIITPLDIHRVYLDRQSGYFSG